jgi:glycosyltransferase involved in cell wall biosynthesis
MRNNKYRILFLTSWYPNRTNPVLALFVKRKAEIMAELCDISVLYATMDEGMKAGRFDVETATENNIYAVRVFFNPFGSGLLKKIQYNFMFAYAHYLGYQRLKQTWGEPEFIHVNVVNRAGYVALFLKYFKGIKYIITEHSTPDIAYLRGEAKTTHIPLRHIKKIAVRNAEYINVDSNPSLQFWEKAGIDGNYGVIKNVVEVFPDLLKIKRERNDGIKKGLHISNMVPRKNVTDIIKAYAHIYHDLNRKNVEFNIIGAGESQPELEKLASDLNVLNKCVFFRGLVDEQTKIRMIIDANYHVLFSDEEGFSVVTAEAIMYGTPVIATRCGGPEDFVPEKVGRLIEKRNFQQLVDAILYMTDHSDEYDPAVLKEYGRENFSPEVIRDNTYRVYEQYFPRK